MSSSFLWEKSAAQVINLIKSNRVTPLQLLEILESRINQVEKENSVNALPEGLRFFGRARLRAKEIESELQHYRDKPDETPIGYLWGLPVVIKDVTDVAGVICTSGSPLLKDYVPQADHPVVRLIMENGGIPYAKSNVPEFGAGSQTFNPLFGATATPFDTKRTSGGSSGGSAAALAAGMCWLATGSDLGGSLRIPASFCGVVGFRPSAGLLPETETKTPATTTVENEESNDDPLLHNLTGPMGRDVLDTSILLDAMASKVTSKELKTKSFRRYALQGMQTLTQTAVDENKTQWCKNVQRIIFSHDVGGTCINFIDERISQTCRSVASKVSQSLSIEIDNEGMNKVFQGIDVPCLFEHLRSSYMWKKWSDNRTEKSTKDELITFLKDGHMKPELAWNIMIGSKISSRNKAAASMHRNLLSQVKDMFNEAGKGETYILCPTTCCLPFNKKIRYLKSIYDKDMRSYVEWLRPTYAVTLMNCPTISIPVGLTSTGLPIGMQIIGPENSDGELIRFAAYVEGLVEFKRVPGPLITLSKENIEDSTDSMFDGPKTWRGALEHHAQTCSDLKTLL